MKRIGALALALCAGALIVAGCGAGGREASVRAVAEGFQRALAQHDGRSACARLSTSAAQTLELDKSKACSAAVLGLGLPTGGRVRHVDVFMTSSAATLSVGTTTFLDETADGWKVSAAGCAPAGKDVPFECGLEG